MSMKTVLKEEKKKPGLSTHNASGSKHLKEEIYFYFVREVFVPMETSDQQTAVT